MSDCLFCKIIAGEIPSSKVYEDELCYAFNDIAPQAPTHFLVNATKEHIGSVSAVTADNSAVVAHIFEVIAKLTRELGLRASSSFPISASRLDRVCFTCTSMCFPVGISPGLRADCFRNRQIIKEKLRCIYFGAAEFLRL